MSAGTKPVLGIILKGYPRISETFISNEILLLEELGFTIRLFSMRHPREPFTHESVKRIKAPVDYLPHTITGHLPQLLGHNIALALKKPVPYARAIKTALRRYSRTRKIATLKHLLQAGILVHKMLPGRGVAHLHAHFAHSPTSVAMFASILSGLPFSFTAHAKDIYTSDPRQLAEKIGQAVFVVTCTEFNRRHLLELAQGLTTPVHRVYHGIDIDLFKIDSLGRQPAPPYQIMTVARLTAKKGLPTVLRALRLLLDRGFSLHHTLIGDGDDRDSILLLIKELGLEGTVEWLGTQPHHQVLKHYRRADLFALGCEQASNGDRDGIPNVFLESMAMGVPVVGTSISGIPELLADEETGLVVPPRRPDKMAEAMARLLTEADLRKGIVTRARNRVVEKFDNTVLIKELASLYRTLGLGGPGPKTT